VDGLRGVPPDAERETVRSHRRPSGATRGQTASLCLAIRAAVRAGPITPAPGVPPFRRGHGPIEAFQATLK
jgi:hypothetical protein